MERIDIPKTIQDILLRHLKECLDDSNIETQAIFDPQRHRYQLLNHGWDGSNRVFGCMVYIEIRNDKIWIQRDYTEIGIANQLLEAGLTHDQIVLGFHSPSKRPYTDFAVQ